MTSTATATSTIVVNDGTSDVERIQAVASITMTAGLGNGTRQTISLASGFNALTVPTGAQGVIITFKAGALTYTLKGVTGDTGIVVQTTTLPTMPIMMPLGTSPSIGITTSGSGGIVDVLWV